MFFKLGLVLSLTIFSAISVQAAMHENVKLVSVIAETNSKSGAILDIPGQGPTSLELCSHTDDRAFIFQTLLAAATSGNSIDIKTILKSDTRGYIKECVIEAVLKSK